MESTGIIPAQVPKAPVKIDAEGFEITLKAGT